MDSFDAVFAQKRQAVAAARAEVEDAKRRLEILEAALAALEEVAPFVAGRAPSGAMAANAHTVSPSSAGKAGGRQVGAISQVWRRILLDMYRLAPDGATGAMIVDFAKPHGLDKMRAGEAERQMKKYMALGYVAPSVMDEGYVVTDIAAKRFSFTKREGEPESSPKPDVDEDGSLHDVT